MKQTKNPQGNDKTVGVLVNEKKRTDLPNKHQKIVQSQHHWDSIGFVNPRESNSNQATQKYDQYSRNQLAAHFNSINSTHEETSHPNQNIAGDQFKVDQHIYRNTVRYSLSYLYNWNELYRL